MADLAIASVRRLVLASSLALLAAAVCPALAHAHALDPVLFELKERPDGKVDVTWKAPNARVPGVDLVPILPPDCPKVGETTKEEDNEATTQSWTIDCGGTIAGRTVGVTGLETTDALLRVTLLSGAVDRRVLGADKPTIVVPAEPSRVDVLRDYALLGVEHIAGGIDHLLFVFGLLLLTAGTRQLIATITAFTLGHSVTLALAALELVTVPQAPVEVVIAITIYILAIELAREVATGSTLLRRRPWAMAFSFGLLHGLGFAGALREAGLPQNDVPLALLAFNVGIEAGQIAFVAIILAAYALARPLLRATPSRLARVPVYAMGVASFYWILERAALLV